MKNTVIAALAVAILAAVFASVFRPDSAGAAYYYNYYFASTLDPWVAGHSSGAAQAELQHASEPNGNGYVVISNKSQGAAWIVASFGGREKRVRVRFDSMKIEGCEGCIPIVYIGNANPTRPEQFSRVGTSLPSEWQTYTVDVPVKSETVVIAVGIESSSPGKAGIDNLNVKRYYR